MIQTVFMTYRLAKWLFPKLRADQRIRRMNQIILVTVLSVVATAFAVIFILAIYYKPGQ